MPSWSAAVGSQTACIAPNSPWQNGCVESCNARRRGELLNDEVIDARREAQIIIESWRRHSDTMRPQGARLQAAGPGGLRASIDRLAGCACPTAFRPSDPWSRSQPCTNLEFGPPRRSRSRQALPRRLGWRSLRPAPADIRRAVPLAENVP
ncbi:hypothetical protein D8770_14930 [Methylobacterium sp. DB1607]|nr:hypothetical protein [Methylobacterium sp. DB1607]